MKKKLVLTSFLALSISMAGFSQVNTTPEVPRNYKPQPKELLPMPDSLTEGQIFPVLGTYDLSDKDGHTSQILITRDSSNTGSVWVSGLPQGKFKADLKNGPATYKIPAQRTLANDITNEVVENSDGTAETTSTKKPKSKVISGRSIQEGTLIFDPESNTLYVNIGSKFNEADPGYIFPDRQALVVNAEGWQTASPATEDSTDKKVTAKTNKKTVIKGINYTGTKTSQELMAPVHSESEN